MEDRAKLRQTERKLIFDLVKRQKELLGQSLSDLNNLLYLHKSISLLSLDHIKSMLVEKLPHILSIRYFTLFLYDDSRKTLELACHNHARIPGDLSLHINDSGIMKDAISKGSYILVHDFVQSKYFKGKRNPLFKNNFFVCIPLMIQNEIVGAINLNDNEKGTFSVGDLDYVLNVADFLAMSISNATNFDKVKTLSITDGLTGLNNHQEMQRVLSNEFMRSRRYESPFSIVMVDLDHFKNVNDTYGHQKGDEILMTIAAILKKACRANDLAARYGGEEFILLLPEAKLQGAFIIAERIREEASRLEFSHEGKSFQLTLSCGVAELDRETMKNHTEFLNVADKALYKAKSGGRNQTVCGSAEDGK